MRFDDELRAQIDRAKRGVPREEWIREACRQRLRHEHCVPLERLEPAR